MDPWIGLLKVHINGYMKTAHISETLRTVYIYILYTHYIYVYIHSISCETLKL